MKLELFYVHVEYIHTKKTFQIIEGMEENHGHFDIINDCYRTFFRKRKDMEPVYTPKEKMIISKL